MSTPAKCDVCGEAMLAEPPRAGVCPKCLMRIGLPTADGGRRSEPAPEAIGPYKILDTLGEGGMGIVYLALQTEPVRRRVALKLIKPGMDSKQVLTRFEAERQALAVMSHPSVAKVYDAGTTEQGRPYFVMEHVPGIPITEYCDLKCLPVDERAELFIQVCEAIQHAHQRGIIHRDIKPSNILVASEDGKPSLKVIDFGVAKATSARLTEQTLMTQQGVFVGTPEYMSPEQAGTTALDVDTRTDVYSLGVLLYELLVGALPFDPQTLRRAAVLEMLRIIREEEPPKPSTRFGSLGDLAPQIAKRRHADVPSLTRQVRGELEWITMRALEKVPDRRYASASEFAADVRRHLRNEPVAAGPRSLGYRATRFLKRHRVAVTAVALVALALLAGIVGTGVALLQARRAEMRAQHGEMIARQVSEAWRLNSLAGLLAATDDDVTAREAIDESLATLERVLGPDHPDVAVGLDVFANVLIEAENYEGARTFLERALAIREKALDADAEDLRLSLARLASVHAELGDYERAKALRESELAILERTHGKDDPEVEVGLRALARVLTAMGDHDGARALQARAVAILEQAHGGEHPLIPERLDDLAALHRRMGDRDEARELYQHSLQLKERTLGADHLDLAPTLIGLAELAAEDGRPDWRPLYERALHIRRRIFADGHPLLESTLFNYGQLLERMGDTAAARSMYEQSLELEERALVPHQAGLVKSLEELAGVLRKTGNHEVARPLYDRAIKIRTYQLDADEPDIDQLYELGLLYVAIEDRAAAERCFDHALKIIEAEDGKESGDYAYARACFRARLGDRPGALEALRRAVELGHLDDEDILNEPDFELLHGDPDFKAILVTARKGQV